MLNLFPSLTHQPLNTWVSFKATGNSFSVSGLSLNDPASTRFYKNNQLQISDFELENSDEFSLEILSPAYYSCPRFAYFKLDDQLSVTGLSTVDDPTLRFNPYYSTKTYFDRLTTPKGEEVLLEADQNSYSVYSREGSLITTIALDSEPTNGEYTNYTYLLEPKSPFISKINLETYELIKKIEVPAPCLGVAQTKIPNTSDPCVWLTMANGQVVCLDKTDTIIHTFRINGLGFGIDASVDGSVIAVADNRANQLVLIEKVGTDWVQSYLSSGGSLPYDVYIDYGRNVWVTSKLGTKIYVYDYGRATPTAIDVGKGQKTIKQINYSTLGVVCTETDEFITIDLYTRQVTSRLTVFPSPVDFCCFDSTIYVATANNLIFRVNADNSVTQVAECGPTLYVLESDQDRQTFYAISLYYNTPSLLYEPDRQTDDLVLDAPLGICLHDLYRADSISIKDITGELYCGFPAILDMEAIVNGQQSALISRIEPQSTISYRFRAIGSAGEQISFPVFVGNNVSYFSTEILASSTQLSPFSFDDVISANPNTSYTSNSITITGLDQPEPFYINAGLLWVNGVQVPSGSLVNNGDVLYLKNSSSAVWGETVSIKAELRSYTEVWSINTKTDLLTYVLKNTFLEEPLYFSSSPVDFGKREIVSLYHIDTQQLSILDLNLLTPTSITPISPLYIASPSKVLYCLDAGNETVSYRESLDYVPYQAIANPLKVAVSYPLNGVVSYYDLDFSNRQDLSVTTPYGIALADNKLWVACGPSGIVKEYRYDVSADSYLFVEQYSLNGFISDVWYNKDTDILYCTDIKNHKIKKISNRMVLIGYDVGRNPYGLAGQGVTICTTDTYDNTLTFVDDDTEQKTVIPLDFPAHAIYSLDRFYYINLENSFVYAIGESAPVISTGMQNSHLYGTNTTLCIAHFYDSLPNALADSSLGTSDDFVSQLAVKPNTLVESNTITFSELQRPFRIKAEGFPDIELIKNTESYGPEVTVNNGDTLSIKVRSSSLYATASSIRIYAGSYNKLFEIKTKENLLPKLIKFQAVYDAQTSSLVTSDEQPISGLGAGVSVPVTVEDPTLVVSLNGIEQKSYPFDVKNGDVLQLSWIVEMLYSSVTTHRLLSSGEVFATFNVYTENLLGPTTYSPFCNFTEIKANDPSECIQYEINSDLYKIERLSSLVELKQYSVSLNPLLVNNKDYSQELSYSLAYGSVYEYYLSFSLDTTVSYSQKVTVEALVNGWYSLKRKYKVVTGSSSLNQVSSFLVSLSDYEIARDYKLVSSGWNSIKTDPISSDEGYYSLARSASYQATLSFSVATSYVPLRENRLWQSHKTFDSSSVRTSFIPAIPSYQKQIPYWIIADPLFVDQTNLAVPSQYFALSKPLLYQTTQAVQGPSRFMLGSATLNSVYDASFDNQGSLTYLRDDSYDHLGVLSELVDPQTGLYLPSSFKLREENSIEDQATATTHPVTNWSVFADYLVFGFPKLSSSSSYIPSPNTTITYPCLYLENPDSLAAIHLQEVLSVKQFPTHFSLGYFNNKTTHFAADRSPLLITLLELPQNLAQVACSPGLKNNALVSQYAQYVSYTQQLTQQFTCPSIYSIALTSYPSITDTYHYTILSSASTNLVWHRSVSALPVEHEAYRLCYASKSSGASLVLAEILKIDISQPLLLRPLPISSTGSNSVLHTGLTWIADQSNLTPELKGSLTLEQAQAEVLRDPSLLITKLPDGTYLYRYNPENAYGECIKNRYLITHGFVKGG